MRFLLPAALAATFALPSGAARAEAPTVLLMPSASYVDAEAKGNNTEEHTDALDLFLNWDTDHGLLLAEYIYTNTEKELERFQVGYRVAPQTRVWAGRFHTQTSYWNSNYHHGAYMRPAIDEPIMARYEDDGGLMPSHIVGAMIDQGIEAGDGLVSVRGVVGLGPHYDGILDPIPITNPVQPARPGYILNFSWQPDITSPTSLGAAVANYEIPSDVAGLDSLYLTPASVSARWIHGDEDLIAEYLRLASSAHLTGAAVDNETIHTGYAQYAHHLPDGFTLYGRADFLDASRGSTLLALLGAPNRRELTAGVRYDFLKRFAFRVEYVRATPLMAGPAENVYAAEISGVYP